MDQTPSGTGKPAEFKGNGFFEKSVVANFRNPEARFDDRSCRIWRLDLRTRDADISSRSGVPDSIGQGPHAVQPDGRRGAHPRPADPMHSDGTGPRR